MPRTEIQVEVLGLESLKSLNTALNRHDKLLSQVAETYGKFKTSVSGATSVVSEAADAHAKHTRALKESSDGAERAGRSFGGLMLQYRALNLVLNSVTEGTRAAVKAMVDLDYQAARSTRLIGTSRRGEVVNSIVGAGMSRGIDTQQAGEAFYQLGTHIKRTDDLAQAFRASIDLMAATEGDARDTTRAVIQVYEQFGDQLGKNVSDAEKYRRATEVLNTVFKISNAEIGEISQSLKYLGPIAAAAHLPLSQVAGVIAGLTSEGVRGRMGGTETGTYLLYALNNYDEKLKGIKKGGQVFHFDMPRDPVTGGVDLVGMAASQRRVMETLPIAEQEKYARAVTGSNNATRFLGSMTEKTLAEIRGDVKQTAASWNGLTHDVQKTADVMSNTFSVQGKAAMIGFFDIMGEKLDDVAKKLGVLNFLKNANTGMQAYQSRREQDQAGFANGMHILVGKDAAAYSWQQQLLQNVQRTSRSLGGETTWSELRPHAHLLEAESNWLQTHFSKDETDALGLSERHIDMAKVQAYLNSLPAKINASRAIGSVPAKSASGLNPTLAGAVAALIAASHGRLHEVSGYRTDEEQRGIWTEALAKYGSESAARWHAAKPESMGGGGSMHSHGLAVDFGGDLAWAHAHAAEFGLHFPLLSTDPMHAELIGSRSAGGYSGPAVTDSPDALSKKRRQEAAAAKRAQHARDMAQKEAEAERAERQREKAERAEIEYETAYNKYGPLDPRTYAAANTADAASYAVADVNERLRLSRGLSGLRPGLKKEIGDSTINFAGLPVPRDWVDAQLSRYQARSDRAAQNADAATEADDIFAAMGSGKTWNDLMNRNADYEVNAMQGRLRAYGQAQRPNLPGVDANRIDLDRWNEQLQELEKTLRLLEEATPGAKAQIAGLKEQITLTKSDLQNVQDRMFTEKLGAVLEALGANPIPGMQHGAIAGRSRSRLGANMDTVGAAQGAYGIFQQGQGSGVNIGNLLGSYQQGSSTFADLFKTTPLIGGLIGGAIDLFGGLFHHRKRPQEDPNHDPANYNSPNDFAYGAYRLRATGQFDPNNTTALALSLQKAAPVVNVYLDNVKQAVRSVVQNQTSLGSASIVNTHYDMHAPI